VNDSRPESAYHVTVVIPTKNAGPEFRETLQAIFDQEGIARLEVIVVDSTSTDDTVAIARDFPVTVHTIEPGEFDHGHTRNLGASLAHGDFLVFLTQDALPANERWLASLVGTVAEDDRAAGGYSRVLPREGASFHAREGVMRDLNARDEPIRQGPCTPAELASASPFERRLLFNFNNVASCMRREAWIRMPFARLRWGEDLMWGRTAIEAGHAIRFVHDSVVLHSHEYDWRTLLSRTRIDGEMNKVLLDRDCVAGPLDALRLAARSTLEDWRVLGRESTPTGRRIILTLRSAGLHGVSMYGLWRGGAAGRHAPGTTRAVENRRLRILFVVHGYPPATLAGTEHPLLIDMDRGLDA